MVTGFIVSGPNSILEPAAHPLRIRATFVACWLIITLLGTFDDQLFAQQSQANKKVSKTQPFVVVCVASFERLLDDADYMFEAAGRPELTELIGGQLARARDLKGLDRNASAGMLLFLDGLIPEPVGFLPVKNVDEMLKTISIGPVSTNKLDEGLYEILGGTAPLFMKVVGGYVFVGRSETALARDFSNPTQYTHRLSAIYDLSASLNLRAIPKATRDFLMVLLRASTEADLQQRDNERLARFRLRKAAGIANLESIEMLLTQAEEITIGFNVSSDKKTAVAELVITADPKSDFAKLLNELGTSHSQFASLLNTPAAMTISASIQLNKTGIAFLKEWALVTEGEIVKDLNKVQISAKEQATPIEEMAQSVNKTVAAGKADFFVQLIGTPIGPFTLVAGLKIIDPARFNIGLEDIFDRVTKVSDIKSSDKRIAEHRGVILHRLEVKRMPEAAEHIFGKGYRFYAGTGNDALWFSIGAEQGLPVLKQVIETVVDAPSKAEPVMPAQFVLHLASLLGVADAAAGSANPVLELLRDSFAQGGGTIRAEMLPISNGMQARLTLDEGYIKLVGKAVSQQIDRQK